VDDVSTTQPPAAAPPPGPGVASPDPATAPPRAGVRPGRILPDLVRTWLRGWPAIVQIALDLILATPYVIIAAFAVAALVTLPVVFVGVPMMLVVLALSWLAGYLERARVWALLGVHIRVPAPPPPDQPLWRRTLFDFRLWRALGHVFAISIWGFCVGSGVVFLLCVAIALATVPAYAFLLPDDGVHLPWDAQADGVWWFALLSVIGIAGMVVIPLLARALVIVDILLARWLLGDPAREEVVRLEERVETLTQTRVATVDSVEVERRRIERDLHDGPQQRLVAIAMDLGMARERLARDPDGARELLDKAHSASKEAITEMRQVARGIHPPVLTDRGLDAALSALAARSPIPVQVKVDVPVRPTPTVEAIAYFCVSEALTNVAKHSRATAARVDVRVDGRWLEVHVSDNGVGGADETRGTGLHGLGDRVRSVDGRLSVSSPPGGPTAVVVRLPMPPARPGRPPGPQQPPNHQPNHQPSHHPGSPS
jgi:signal transduction histidine kinase